MFIITRSRSSIRVIGSRSEEQKGQTSITKCMHLESDVSVLHSSLVPVLFCTVHFSAVDWVHDLLCCCSDERCHVRGMLWDDCQLPVTVPETADTHSTTASVVVRVAAHASQDEAQHSCGSGPWTYHGRRKPANELQQWRDRLVTVWQVWQVLVSRVRPIPISGIVYQPILASIGWYRYRPILILVSAPIPVVRLPVSTVNTVARTPIVSSL